MSTTNQTRATDGSGPLAGESPSGPTVADIWQWALDEIPDLVCVMDESGRVLRANRALAQRLATMNPEMPAEQRRCWIHGLQCSAAVCACQGMMHWADSTKHEISCGQSGLDFSVVISPIRNRDGSTAGFVHVARDITAEKRRHRLQEATSDLAEFVPDKASTEVLRLMLDRAESLTGSRIGFMHFVEEGQDSISLQVWSTNTELHMCKAQGQGAHYALSHAGVWADAVRERRTVIHNDYAALAHRRGLPEGHAPVARELVVPVFRGGRIVAVMGVGNKGSDYRAEDAEIVSHLASVAWDVYVRLRAEESLRQRAEELRGEVEQRRRLEVELRAAMDRLTEATRRVGRENVILREELDRSAHAWDMVGDSAPMRAVRTAIEQVARTDSTVLLTGETGTGKEVAARLIHESSDRAHRRMFVLDCAAISPSLVEGELFGSERGAYTGAGARRIGRFEAADGSTLFLDEIDSLSLDMQAKLLRVLESGEFERLGSADTLKTNVRIIAATNRDLADRVRDGLFRTDLFYRLNVFPIHLPPLRNRTEDIGALVRHFVKTIDQGGFASVAIDEQVIAPLRDYHWPGNIRELRNVVEHALIVRGDGMLVIAPPVPRARKTAFLAPPPQAGPPARIDSLADADRAHIMRALDACGWRIRGDHGAAALLGLKPTTLEARMVKLGIRRPSAG